MFHFRTPENVRKKGFFTFSEDTEMKLKVFKTHAGT